ncbi:MAG: chorismate synthase, partial [Oscillospiraceae bacterium]|nr:chorismate synthase [Oscillospiraceae bacterium]
LAHLLFSIPAVKGVEFGKGFAMAGLRGSQANDPLAVKDGRVVTLTNNNGGVNGGVTNGMPVVFRAAYKPTPSIYKPQHTVDLSTGQEAELQIQGRHDPCIVPRAAVVQTAAAAFGLLDLLTARYGTLWQKEGL